MPTFPDTPAVREALERARKAGLLAEGPAVNAAAIVAQTRSQAEGTVQQADFTLERREALTLRLPWPPSVNNYRAIFTWIKAGKAHARLITSKAGRDYMADVQAALGKRTPFAGRLAVTVVTHQPTAAKIDLDNRLKALLDALKHCRVIEDDSQIDELQVRRGGISRSGAFVDVTVSQL